MDLQLAIIALNQANDALLERAERAEDEVARLRSAGQRLLDAPRGTEEWTLAVGMMIDALATTSAKNTEET